MAQHLRIATLKRQQQQPQQHQAKDHRPNAGSSSIGNTTPSSSSSNNINSTTNSSSNVSFQLFRPGLSIFLAIIGCLLVIESNRVTYSSENIKPSGPNSSIFRPSSKELGEYHHSRSSQNDNDNYGDHDVADNHDDQWPKLAWLMSFPNSGTSYTSQVIKHYTNTKTASNYGLDNLDTNDESVPLYANDWDGPFIADPQLNPKYTIPHKYVLTKTHCGGRCGHCGPNVYIETTHSFRRRCFATRFIRKTTAAQQQEQPNQQNRQRELTAWETKLDDDYDSDDDGYEDDSTFALNSTAVHELHYNNDGVSVTFGSQYDASHLSKAIHLIRNPFDNVVSRFHLSIKKYNLEIDTKNSTTPKLREMFREWCYQLNEKYEKEERESNIFAEDNELWDIMKDVPCRADFIRYVEWHNLAFITTNDLDLDTYVLHYENYSLDFNNTVHQLIQFLELQPHPTQAKILPFVEGKQYAEDYFNLSERDAVKKALHSMSQRRTWRTIKHYFS